MEKISILVPTRHRPLFIQDLIHTCLNTCEYPDLIEFVFYIDNDDDESFQCFTKLSKQQRSPKFIVGERIVLSQMWNKCYEICTGNIIMHCGDDLRFRTFHWDTIIRNKFDEYTDKILFVFGYDGVHQKGTFGTHGFIHRNWVETIGYFVPPYFSSDYNDTWLNDVAKMINRWVYVDIYTEHLHPIVKKHFWDKTHQERLDRHKHDKVDNLYQLKLNERIIDANKLLTFIQNQHTDVGFIGLGKLGLPVALGMANKGHFVTGYDINPLYNENTKPSQIFHEVEEGLDDILDHKNFKMTRDLSFLVQFSEIIFIAVQTPHDPLYEGITRVPNSVSNFNYSYLQKSINDVVNLCNKLKLHRIVVIISTVLPNTLNSILPTSDYVSFCYNPFFIAMGSVLHDFYNPEFILLGCNDPTTTKRVCDFYSSINNSPVFKTTIENAELIKVSYNTMISMKLAFVNQLMEICDKIPNTNVDDVTDALKLATKRLISPAYLTAGMGDGGGCHPRDNIAMSWLSKELHLKTDFCSFIMNTREKQTEFLADLCIHYSFETNLPIVILGKSFKPNIKITTGSPSILLYNILKEYNVNVEIYDEMPVNQQRSLFFIGTKHDIFQSLSFPDGSFIIDPHRYIPKSSKYQVYHVGNNTI